MPLRNLATQARRYAGALAIESFFHGFSTVAKMHPRAKPERHGLERIADVPYVPGSTSKAHLLDIYRPDPSAPIGDRHDGPPWPVVLYVHGGAFRILSKETHWIMGLAYGRRGYLVFNVNYRLAPKHRYPAALEDVSDALLWVLENAPRYGGDTGRLVFAGESAGANLVTSLALACCYERPEPFAQRVFRTGIVPRAVVPACGLFQVSDLARLKRRKPQMSLFVSDRIVEIERMYLGKGPWEHGLDLADPVVMVERGEKPARPLPPFFLPVGTRDPLLPDSRRLGRALRALGGEAIERYYRGEIHAFHALVFRGVARECWSDIYAFLDGHVPLR